MQDVGRDDSLAAASGQHHDHVAPGAHVLDVVRQVLELFEIQRPDQRPLKLRQESMIGPGRIEATEVLLTMQDIDVLAVESGSEQRIDSCLRLRGVANGADDAIGRIPDEIPVIGARCFHGQDPCSAVCG